ncbi:MAG: hypothetical protein QF578_07745 [Alphaproteobacteria bacterium]|jgi:hypothetical protein|nr:hypothetical protein [Alphaproteobacteria bacterium]MDP6564701.1 hypothetical protein [Alphaproteobacteria bacterium]MDP6815993.1 hypothetical protein [Alphaproteobacteria bacterium]
MPAVLRRIIDYYRQRSPITLLWHHGALLLIVAVLLVAGRFTVAPWLPVFWPLLIWYVIFAFHFLLLRSLSVGDDWADARADKLRRQAYDFQHVKEIYKEPTTFKTPKLPRRDK